MRVPVVPFLTPAPDAISHGGWRLTTVEGDVELPRELSHWDYQTTIEIAAPVSVNRTAVTADCQLAWESGLAVLVMARSSRTNVEFVASRLDVPLAATFDLAVELSLSGEELGNRLTLETLLVATEPFPLGPLSPQHPGSILWRRSHWTDLEGFGAQFPAEAMDFAQARRDPQAGWELKIDVDDSENHFMSAVRLIMNSGNPAIARLLRGEKDAGTEQLRRVLDWDVTRQMVYAGLRSEDVASLDMDLDTVSVAGVLRNLLATIWPLESVGTIRQWAEQDPSRIETRLQDHCGLLP